MDMADFGPCAEVPWRIMRVWKFRHPGGEERRVGRFVFRETRGEATSQPLAMLHRAAGAHFVGISTLASSLSTLSLLHLPPHANGQGWVQWMD